MRINHLTHCRQITHPEKELGVTFLHRKGRGVHLTEAGAEFYRHITRVEERIQSATEAMKKSRTSSMIEVGNGAPPTIGPHF